MWRVLMLLSLATTARAQDGSALLVAIQAQRWAEADTIAAQLADPMAAKLTRYYRLLTPGAAGAGEIATFLANNPSWPSTGLLSRRWSEALVLEPDDRTAQALCSQRPPDAPATLLRCATAGRSVIVDPAVAAREAWVRGIDGPAEAAFLKQWGRVLTGADQWRRFDRLPGPTPAHPVVRPRGRPCAWTPPTMVRPRPGWRSAVTTRPPPPWPASPVPTRLYNSNSPAGTVVAAWIVMRRRSGQRSPRCSHKPRSPGAARCGTNATAWPGACCR